MHPHNKQHNNKQSHHHNPGAKISIADRLLDVVRLDNPTVQVRLDPRRREFPDRTEGFLSVVLGDTNKLVAQCASDSLLTAPPRRSPSILVGIPLSQSSAAIVIPLR